MHKEVGMKRKIMKDKDGRMYTVYICDSIESLVFAKAIKNLSKDPKATGPDHIYARKMLRDIGKGGRT